MIGKIFPRTKDTHERIAPHVVSADVRIESDFVRGEGPEATKWNHAFLDLEFYGDIKELTSLLLGSEQVPLSARMKIAKLLSGGDWETYGLALIRVPRLDFQLKRSSLTERNEKILQKVSDALAAGYKTFVRGGFRPQTNRDRDQDPIAFVTVGKHLGLKPSLVKSIWDNRDKARWPHPVAANRRAPKPRKSPKT
jgi:hypothetical protein